MMGIYIYFNLCNRPITLDILLPIMLMCNLKLRLLSIVKPKKIKTCTYSIGDPFKSNCKLGFTFRGM